MHQSAFGHPAGTDCFKSVKNNKILLCSSQRTDALWDKNGPGPRGVRETCLHFVFLYFFFCSMAGNTWNVYGGTPTTMTLGSTELVDEATTGGGRAADHQRKP